MTSQSENKVASELVFVTPYQATSWLTHDNYEKQRPLRTSHVEYLSNEIKKGRLIAGTPIHFASDGNRRYLVNGQHTLAAIAHAKMGQLLTVMLTRVSSAQEIAELYFRHDNHLSRTISDAFRALDLVDKIDLTLTEQQWLGSAFYLISEGFCGKGGAKTRVSRDDLAQGVIRLAKPARRYFDALSGCRSALMKALTRRASVAVGVVTMHYCLDIAPDFWREVAHDDGLKIGDPKKTLSDFLVETGASGGGIIGRRSASSPYHCRAIATAWNAFYQGKPLKLIKVFDESAEIKILGTPYGHLKTKPLLFS